MRAVQALEIGGTHVTAATVDLAKPAVVPTSWTRVPLDADGSANAIVATFGRAAVHLRAPSGSAWGIAIPGPFDYAAGIGRFEGVAKFGALNGVDVGRRMRDRLPAGSRVSFVNDADAFLIGEWAAGAAVGQDRVAGITLGTGIGSAFLADGQIVNSGPDVPPFGEVHRLEIDGRPLEETVSRRAIRARFARRPGDALSEPLPDVGEIATRARAGDTAAREAIHEPLRALGRALRPWLERFGATVLIVGGAMTASWDLVQPGIGAGLGPRVTVLPARLPDDAGLIGAALHASRQINTVATRQTGARHGGRRTTG